MAILRQCLMQVRMHHHQWDVPVESWPDAADGSVPGFPAFASQVHRRGVAAPVDPPTTGAGWDASGGAVARR
jgi:hypothetical protein